MLRYGDGRTFLLVFFIAIRKASLAWCVSNTSPAEKLSTFYYHVQTTPIDAWIQMISGVMLNGVGLGMLSPNTPLSLSRVATQQQQLCIAELDPDSWFRFHCCLTSHWLHSITRYHQYLLSPDPWCCNPSRKTQNCSRDPPSRESTLGAHDW